MDVKNIVSKSLERKANEESKKREVGRYYPTESWSCLRKKFFSFYDYESEKPLPHGIFEMGRRVEAAIYEMLQDHFNEDKMSNDLKVKVDLNEYIISGETDPVLYKEADKKEIKTIFEVKSQANLFSVKEPHEHHVKQLMCYLKGLNVDQGIVLYVNRSNLEDIKNYDVNFDEDIWEEIETHFDIYHDYIKNKILPPKSPLMNWECRYCQYKERCLSIKE